MKHIFSIVTALSLLGTAAYAEEKVTPGRAAPPKFSCSVAPNEKGDSMVTIKKTGGGPTAADKDVVATVNGPSDKKDAAVCGKSLEKDGSEAKVSVSMVVKPKFPYTCTAVQGKTTFACNPVK